MTDNAYSKSGHSVLVYLDFPTFRRSLSLNRTPHFLRFTATGQISNCTWDALDQLDDNATPEEQVFAARLVSHEKIHCRRHVKKQSTSEWRQTATYELIDDGPSEEVLRSNEKWRQWCVDRAKAGSEKCEK